MLGMEPRAGAPSAELRLYLSADKGIGKHEGCCGYQITENQASPESDEVPYSRLSIYS